MNQKYLMGIAAEGGQAVVFEAKASNVAAFISQNRMAPELLICTLDYKMFLTARRGMIDMCPDRKFWCRSCCLYLCQCKRARYRICRWCSCRARAYRMKNAHSRIGIICGGMDMITRNLKRSWTEACCLTMNFSVKRYRWSGASANMKMVAVLLLNRYHGRKKSRRIGTRSP